MAGTQRQLRPTQLLRSKLPSTWVQTVLRCGMGLPLQLSQRLKNVMHLVCMKRGSLHQLQVRAEV